MVLKTRHSPGDSQFLPHPCGASPKATLGSSDRPSWASLFFVWVSLSERKWIVSRERRGDGGRRISFLPEPLIANKLHYRDLLHSDTDFVGFSDTGSGVGGAWLFRMRDDVHNQFSRSSDARTTRAFLPKNCATTASKWPLLPEKSLGSDTSRRNSSRTRPSARHRIHRPHPLWRQTTHPHCGSRPPGEPLGCPTRSRNHRTSRASR
jgi:hypothetical protein